jgi:hypothetical protein
MNEDLLTAVTQWQTANRVELATNTTEDGDFIELKWQRPAGDWGYISVVPDNDNVVIVQHGTFEHPEKRDQRGINRFSSSNIQENLTHLKGVVDTSKESSPWTYTPRVDIGRVASLKFR